MPAAPTLDFDVSAASVDGVRVIKARGELDTVTKLDGVFAVCDSRAEGLDRARATL